MLPLKTQGKENRRTSGRVRDGEVGSGAAAGERRGGTKGGIADTLTRGGYRTVVGAHSTRGAEGYLPVMGERAGDADSLAPGALGRVGWRMVGGRLFGGGARPLQGNCVGGALRAVPQCSRHTGEGGGEAIKMVSVITLVTQ